MAQDNPGNSATLVYNSDCSRLIGFADISKATQVAPNLYRWSVSTTDYDDGIKSGFRFFYFNGSVLVENTNVIQASTGLWFYKDRVSE